MHRTVFGLICAFLYAITLFLQSCSGRNSEPTYLIGVSQDNSDVWHDKMRDEILQEAVLHPELKLIMTNAYAQLNRQATQIDSLVKAGVDLLIVGVEDPMSVIDATNRAFDAGIPVVINSRNSKMTKYTAYVGTDNYAVGELMAQYLKDLAVEDKHTKTNPLCVVELLGKIGVPAVSERYIGLRENLKGCGEVCILSSLYADWDYQKAYMLTDSLIKNLPRIDVIITQNDVMALGAYAAGKDNHPDKNYHILGVDALSGQGSGVEAIIDGKIAASITNVSRGDLIVQIACNILHGQPYTKDSFLQPVLVDQSSHKLMMRMAQEMQNETKVINTLQMEVDKLWSQTYKLKNKNIILIFSLAFLLAAVVLSIILYYNHLRVKKEREQNERVMTIQQQQLEQIAAELERVKSSQSMDEQFLQRLQEEFEKHLDDCDYSVDDLSETLGVSRAQLFRRVKALTGVTPLAMLKQVRLRKARQLLQYTDLNIQQVAYSVGYSLPAYFAKNYKEAFGILPSEERKKNIINENKSRRK